MLLRLVLALALTAGLGGAALAQAVPQSRADIALSFAPVVKRAVPAVVNVYAQRVEQRRRNPILDDPFFRDLFGLDGGVVPRERVQRSLGSGVIVDAGGLVVTNNHVIDEATEVRVALADKREFEAEIVLRDRRADLAVLRLKGVEEPLATLDFAPDGSTEVGDMVLAIGNPFGVGQTVTLGIVSALARTQTGISDFQSFIQTDAAINPGNSGGALVDMAGRLVGINTAIFSRSGGSIGIGFAIPAPMVRVVVASALAGASAVQRPYAGASFQAVTAEIAESLGLDRPRGALVTAVASDGPAAAAGLRPGDLVVAVDGDAVEDPDDFGYKFATRPLGGTTRLTVLRGGRERDLTVALKLGPESVPRNETLVRGPSPLNGATLANLSPRLAEDLGLEIDSRGVVITAVAEDTPAAALGFRAKDVIVAVNGAPAEEARALARALREPSRRWRITIDRDGRRRTNIFGG